MDRDLLDLYSDYLLCSSRQTTATGLSGLVNGTVSHDKITRFLSDHDMDEKTLWKKIKRVVREYENDGACLIFDDTIIEKEYMDENEIICWYYDHKRGQTVKGINLLTAFYSAEKGGDIVRIPVGYRILAKTEKYRDEKTGQERRKSPVTKNEMMRDMIGRQIRNEVKFGFVLADSWYSSAENMRFIDKKKKTFIFELKENRQVTADEGKRGRGEFERADHLAIPEGEPVKVWLKDLSFAVVLFKQVFTNKDQSRGTRFLVSNDLTLTEEQFRTLYKKRWGVEEYHKSLKQNASVGSSPAHTERTQSNHIFAAIFGFVKLEKLKVSKKINHFAIKTMIYMASLKTALSAYDSFVNAPPA
ncbi:MAG: transposase [Treponema sp.]|jgi:hypothetical protein|nr:transposase [Treponema sp.]